MDMDAEVKRLRVSRRKIFETLVEVRDWFEFWEGYLGDAEEAILRKINAAITEVVG